MRESSEVPVKPPDKSPETRLGVIEREFSYENMSAYGQMCTEVAWELTQAIDDKRGEITILLPSRGALPIFMGAMLALERNETLRQTEIAQRINLPPLACFNYARERIERHSQLDKGIDVLIFPFTADVNLDGKVESEKDAREVVDDMRCFGARAVADFFNPPEQRDSFELKLFLTFLDVVEKRKGIVTFYRDLIKQVKNLVMIDTVISGRASFTILSELEKNGVRIGEEGNLRPILVVDEKGKKLKSPFRRFVDNNFRQRIDVPRILSEDRGAALEGVVAVVYPDLIIAAQKAGLCPDCYPLFGSWRDVPTKVREDYLGVFDSFLRTIDTIVTGKRDVEIEKERADFCKTLKQSGVLLVGDALIGKEELNIPKAESIKETSAHVIQPDFSPRECQNFIRKIKKKMEE